MIKGPLLPKILRIKGKSKYLYPRLVEEKIPFGIDRWDGKISWLDKKKGIPDNPLMRLYRKYKLV